MIKNFFKKILGYFSFGLKQAENEMFSQKDGSNGDNMSIVEVQQENRLSRDLLNAEVTQQVEELRYRNYQVHRESNNYQYIGNGIAIKKDKKEKSSKYNFSINNNVLCKSVLDGLNAIEKNDFGIDKYTLAISYFDIPRFRLESFCQVLDVEVDNDLAYLTFHFSSFYDKFDKFAKTFINELDKLSNVNTIYDVKRQEVCSNIESISFTTYKASNEDDMILYKFNDIEYLSYEKTNFEFLIKYVSKTFDKIDLIDKFYSETMSSKYLNNEKKDVVLDLSFNDRKEVCSICGEEMSKYDAAITKEEYGYTMCVKCLENKMIKENKFY